jgi:chromate transporter
MCRATALLIFATEAERHCELHAKRLRMPSDQPGQIRGPVVRVSLRAASMVWLRVALLSFGGPAGQIAVMHRVLVDEKKWISERRFLHALNFCMLLPGPEAQQLATYVGWLLNGTWGGLIAGGLFVLPGALAILALSIVYVTFGAVGAVSGAFFGLKAAVLAIVLQAIQRLSARALQSDASKAVAFAAFVALYVLNAPFPLVVLVAGLAGLMDARARALGFAAPYGSESEANDPTPIAEPRSGAQALRVAGFFLALWLAPIAALVLLFGVDDVYARIAMFFSKMAVVSFGGAYAALSYVAQQAVERFHWLDAREMLDGLGMAETTPGPLIMVVQFVGFLAAYRHPGSLAPLVAGSLGGLLSTYVTFAPSFLWIFAAAPYVERLRANRALAGALAAISAAVVGVIANLALFFALRFLFHDLWTTPGLPVELPVLTSLDVEALALSVVAFAALRFGLAPTLLIGVIAGLALRSL